MALSIPTANAQEGEGREPINITEGTIGSDKMFGIGLQAGSVSGVSLKYFLNQNNALQAGVGTGFSSVYGSSLAVSVDFLTHPWMLYKNSHMNIPLYVGGGAGARLYSDSYYSDYNSIQGHGTVGSSLELTKFPFDFFLQIEAGLNVASGGLGFHYGTTSGARFYF